MATTTTNAVEVDAISASLATPHTSLVARANVDLVNVLADPNPGATVIQSLPRQDPTYRGDDGATIDQVFLVEEHQDGYLKVLLPVRPNGSTGWISLADVQLSQHTYEIVVDLDAFTMTTTNNGEVIQEAPIAVGTQDTPTPGGKFFLNALLKPPNPDTVYGTYAYALSGYSDTLRSFAGGDGVIGIHGTNDASVVGTNVSHGCIRMSNENIEALVAQLPLGTPVEIVA